MGHANGLAPELESDEFRRALAPLGLALQKVDHGRLQGWADYGAADAVLAVRNFSRSDWTWKPASKLVNAWLAGVPAVLGVESAYRDLRRSELDYLEVDSPSAALGALQRLRTDVALRTAMVENGRRRALEFSPSRVADMWRSVLAVEAVGLLHAWRGSRVRRLAFRAARSAPVLAEIAVSRLIGLVERLRVRAAVRSRLRRCAGR